MVYAEERTSVGASGIEWDENALARATNAGERRAASVLLTRGMPALLNASRAIAGRAMEAEELLSVALLATWEKWAQGRGPIENVHAYIAQAMRNRLRDEMRAPRSRNVALDPRVHEFASGDETERIHAEIDNTIVVMAMHRLPEEQRMLLTDVVIDGRKPQSVAADLGRSAARVSSAVYRAKAALRTELVLECLRRACASPACCVDRAEVALLIGAKRSSQAEHPALAAARQCPGCRAGLQSYGVLAGLESSDIAA